jgi:HEAT repeat protein
MGKHVFWVGLVCVLLGAILAIGYGLRVREAAPAKGSSPAERVAVLRSRDRPPGVDRLLEALKDEDADVRLVAAMRLHGLKDRAQARALLKSLKDPDPHVRSGAALALDNPDYAKERPPRPPGEVQAALRVLCELVKAPDVELRREAVGNLGLGGLGTKGEEDRTAVAALCGALQDRDAEVRARAAEGLRRAGPSSLEVAAGGLHRALGDEDRRVREAAASSLRELEVAQERVRGNTGEKPAGR